MNPIEIAQEQFNKAKEEKRIRQIISLLKRKDYCLNQIKELEKEIERISNSEIIIEEYEATGVDCCIERCSEKRY
jgi:flagellar biosynthesis/type III secretory pathway chaperone